MAITTPENILNPEVAFTKNINIINGTHILYVSSNPDLYIDNAVSYVSSGLTLGQAVVFIDDRGRYNKVVERLFEKGFQQEQVNRIVFAEHNEFYQTEKYLDVKPILRTFSSLLEPLVTSGVPIRAWGRVKWIPGQCCLPEKLREYEGAADDFITKVKCLTVCAYDGEELPSTVMMEIVKHHQYIMSDTEIALSGFYKKEKLSPSIMIDASLENSLEKFKDLQKLYSEFIEEMPDSVFITLNGVIVHINKAGLKLMDCALIELIGKPILEIAEPTSHELLKERLNMLKNDGKMPPTEIKLLKTANETIDVEVVSFPFMFEEYLNDTEIMVVRDLRERKENEKLAIRSEKLGIAGELAASIAHEIRNPLTAIKGFIQLAKEGFTKVDIFSILDSEINRIETIASELLVLGKPISERKQRSEVGIILQNVCTLMQSQANMAGIHIQCDEIEPNLFIDCNEEQLKQVLINLIKNGIEAIETSGTVKVQLKSHNQKVIIKIEDNGKGIPRHIQHKLGEPFYSTKEKGTGLGIMVCYRIIEQHNGKIEFSSKEGEGTTFMIELPLL
ncbi:ATP-binding protein [Bacillus pinisoli]|uniref:ATP-binding protein n=1 Tax=Bacillus pinisoli TaxID=2901866 RepID=UPI001FF31E40|nr:ATP-binding protein [Bacillus pinisoli]